MNVCNYFGCWTIYNNSISLHVAWYELKSLAKCFNQKSMLSILYSFSYLDGFEVIWLVHYPGNASKLINQVLKSRLTWIKQNWGTVDTMRLALLCCALVPSLNFLSIIAFFPPLPCKERRQGPVKIDVEMSMFLVLISVITCRGKERQRWIFQLISKRGKRKIIYRLDSTQFIFLSLIVNQQGESYFFGLWIAIQSCLTYTILLLEEQTETPRLIKLR